MSKIEPLLENFRQQWKREIERESRTSNDSSLAETNIGSESGQKVRPRSPVRDYQLPHSFVIAQGLLNGKSGSESLQCDRPTDQIQQQAKRPVEELCGPNKDERFLDIFLNDLVSCEHVIFSII